MRNALLFLALLSVPAVRSFVIQNGWYATLSWGDHNQPRMLLKSKDSGFLASDQERQLMHNPCEIRLEPVSHHQPGEARLEYKTHEQWLETVDGQRETNRAPTPSHQIEKFLKQQVMAARAYKGGNKMQIKELSRATSSFNWAGEWVGKGTLEYRAKEVKAKGIPVTADKFEITGPWDWMEVPALGKIAETPYVSISWSSNEVWIPGNGKGKGGKIEIVKKSGEKTMWIYHGTEAKKQWQNEQNTNDWISNRQLMNKLKKSSRRITIYGATKPSQLQQTEFEGKVFKDDLLNSASSAAAAAYFGDENELDANVQRELDGMLNDMFMAGYRQGLGAGEERQSKVHRYHY